MSSLLDYLDWRGDLSFSQVPVNEVDAYILSTMGIFDWTGIVQGDQTGIVLSEAGARLFDAQGDLPPVGASSVEEYAQMLKKACASKRFGGIVLSRFRDILVEEGEEVEQFSAITQTLPDGSRFIAFRGTDFTFAGWKEDCMLALNNDIPAQRHALEYLKEAASEPGFLYLGGHSKGGNLSVYAASKAPAVLQRRIRKVYNLDGPGFSVSFLKSAGALRIQDRVLNILPQYSLVGMLFHHTGELRIVHSDAAGPKAHNGFTWGVYGADYVGEQNFAKSSLLIDNSLDKTLESMDENERKNFIDELFSILSADGARSLEDLATFSWHQAVSILRAYGQGGAVQQFLRRFTEALRKDRLERPENNSTDFDSSDKI